jgi:aryl-alcohol dehydrogenase-like predicted oxidoreductase
VSVLWQPVSFGSTGLAISRLGLGSSYGVAGADVERAFERGVNFMFWGLRRRGDFGAGLRSIAARRREDLVLAVQSYTRVGALMGTSLDCALRALGTDYVDMLCLGWWDELPPERILDAARRLKDRGKARHLVISCHHRPSFELMARTPGLEGIMVRYNAAHPGAERDVFPLVANTNPGVIAFTATRWGSLLDPKLVPSGEPVPRASDCYRFVLTHPSVHTTLAGPKNGAELDEAMAALDRGPMDPEELAWMRRVGLAVRGDTKAHRAVEQIDRARSFLTGGERRTAGEAASRDASPPQG